MSTIKVIQCQTSICNNTVERKHLFFFEIGVLEIQDANDVDLRSVTASETRIEADTTNMVLT